MTPAPAAGSLIRPARAALALRTTGAFLAALLLALAACDGGPAAGAGDAAAAPDAPVLDPSVDHDGDGYSKNQGDCDEGNPAIHPGAVEICDDNVDNNCNGAIDMQEPDEDHDGYGPCQGDCDDLNETVNPAAEEVPDGADNDCDGITDGDYDGDGFTVEMGDCDDDDPSVHPGARENCYDGKDNDCNGLTDTQEGDQDNDGYGRCGGDCNDSDPAVHPAAVEVVDGIDNNCDNLVDEDLDGDGWTVQNGDCDDQDRDVRPGLQEICGNNKDDDCNGFTDEEVDLDGDELTNCAGDCDDRNPSVRPGYVEDPTDGTDNDCNGLIDEAVECDCSATNEALAMDLCTPDVQITYGGSTSAHGFRVNQNFGAVTPRHGCGYFTVSTGPAWSTSVQPGTALGVLSANPVTVTGCFPCTLPGGTFWAHMLPNGCCEDDDGFDVAYVHVTVPVPHNARGFSFDFIYLSAEYPEWVHTGFNDTLYVIAETSALPLTQNISFDINGQPLTVNNGWFETPPNWSQSIAGTGYDLDGSASGWLTTSCPATPGETLQLWFWIHDEGDSRYDSAVVVDNWRWVLVPLSGPVTIK